MVRYYEALDGGVFFGKDQNIWVRVSFALSHAEPIWQMQYGWYLLHNSALAPDYLFRSLKWYLSGKWFNTQMQERLQSFDAKFFENGIYVDQMHESW